MTAPRSKTFALRYPFELDDGTTVAEVTLHRAKGKTLRQLDALLTDTKRGDMNEAIMMLTLISGQPEVVFDEMDADDLIMLTEAMPDFFPAIPETGGGGAASSQTAPIS